MAKIHGLLNESIKLDANYKLNTPSSTERGETQVLTAINSYIQKIGKPIDIQIGRTKLKNIYGANKVAGTPKADIALVTYNKISKKFEEVYFISHKMGASAKDYQQYSGITDKADGNKAGAISKHKEVIKFLKDISKVHKTITKSKVRYYRKIKDKTLVGKAVYGPEFGGQKFNHDNIQLIAQGTPTFTKSGNFHQLSFSAAMCFSPDVKHIMQNDYTAVIAARYTEGRNYEVDGKQYSGVRVLIMPIVVIGGQAHEI